MTSFLKQAPAQEPIGFDAVKAYLKVENEAEDSLIRQLILSARTLLESHLRLSFIQQTWVFTARLTAHDGMLKLPRGPVISVVRVSEIVGDTVKDLDLNDMKICVRDEYHMSVKAPNWGGKDLQVEYITGFGEQTSDVPQEIAQALFILVGAWFENRGSQDVTSDMLQNIAPLLEPFKTVKL